MKYMKDFKNIKNLPKINLDKKKIIGMISIQEKSTIILQE